MLFLNINAAWVGKKQYVGKQKKFPEKLANAGYWTLFHGTIQLMIVVM